MIRFATVVFALAAGLLAAPAGAQVQYIHTDALGSVVAVTDANRNVIDRREFAPYGDQLNAPAADRGPGYTGHVEDGLTGLTYMQQRYYDPAIGRFLSVDPVGPLQNPINHFGRYHYANNNPYKYVDADGRLPILIPIAVVAWRAYSAYDTATTAAENVSTVVDTSASTGDRALAGAELFGSAVGGKWGRQAAGGVARAVSRADKIEKHHVVPHRDPRAQSAQDHMRAHGIDPRRDSDNIVPIPGDKHDVSKRESYVLSGNDRILAQPDAASIRAECRCIADELKSSTTQELSERYPRKAR